MSTQRVARGVLVVDDERRDAALPRVHARRRRAPSRVTCTPVNSVDGVGSGDVRERVLGHHDDVEQAEREGRSRHARAGHREQRRAPCPRRARPRGRACPTRAARRRPRASSAPDVSSSPTSGMRELAGESHRPLDGRAARSADRAVVLAARDAEPHRPAGRRSRELRADAAAVGVDRDRAWIGVATVTTRARRSA